MTSQPHDSSEAEPTPEGNPTERAWEDERIEAWLPTQGLVYVFRYVPTYSRDYSNHPTLAEWTQLLLAAAEGLMQPSIEHRNFYDSDQFGVGGHRPMTDEERAAHRESLARRITHDTAMVELLSTESSES